MSQQKYLVYVAQAKEGLSVSASAAQYLLQTGALYDEAVGGYVLGEGNSFPVGYSIFITSNNLEIVQKEINYDPEWFTALSPPIEYEDIPPWDGGVIRGSNKVEQQLVWFLKFPVVVGQIFLGYWDGQRWNIDGAKFFPAEAVARWVFASTFGEAGQMSCKRIDDANKARASKFVRSQIINDVTGSAYQVAVATGRVKRASIIRVV